MGSWGEPSMHCYKAANEGDTPVPKPKYPPFLDPIKEEIKKEHFKILRNPPPSVRKVFAPLELDQDLLCYDVNAFSIEKLSPIKPWVQNPKMLTCHICGGGFGIGSFENHLKVCAELFEAHEEQREPGEPQKDLPSRPSLGPSGPDGTWTHADVAAYNDAAMEVYLNETLIECERCNRKFTDEAFKHHYNGCDKPEKPGAKICPCQYCGKLLFSDQHRLYHNRKCRSNFWDLPTCARKTLMPCYVCGREFSERSIDRHVATCEKLWVQREETHKVYPDERLPLPPKISAGAGGTDDSRRETLKQCQLGCGVLKTCQNCNRSFFAESYEKHIRGCGTEETLENFKKRQAKSKGRPVGGMGCADGYFRKYNPKPSEMGVCCYICSRKFGHASIEIHLKHCAHTWSKREAKKEGTKEEIKPVPARPAQFDDFIAKKMSQKEWNSWVIENCGSYVPCPRCNRTFFADRLAIHMAGCKEGEAKSVWK